jgi:hypothetical protein
VLLENVDLTANRARLRKGSAANVELKNVRINGAPFTLP